MLTHIDDPLIAAPTSELVDEAFEHIEKQVKVKARCTIEGGKPGCMNGVLDAGGMTDSRAVTTAGVRPTLHADEDFAPVDAGRHLDLRCFLFQQPDFLKKARLVKVSEQDHVADVCTKPLPH